MSWRCLNHARGEEFLDAALREADFDSAVRAVHQSLRAGRGAVQFVLTSAGPAVWRHYQRGGLIRHVLGDRYLFRGASQTRCRRELELLHKLRALHLPVPEPLAARYQRSTWFYRADLLMRAIEDSCSLAQQLQQAPADIDWLDLGQVLARFHRVGADHRDLNAHNVLRDATGRFFIIDWDGCALRNGSTEAWWKLLLRRWRNWREQGTASDWRGDNLQRLLRSLRKLNLGETSARALRAGWTEMQRGYDAGMHEPQGDATR
jgi:3-deoxy-D-manno-octulosonic acid kinase